VMNANDLNRPATLGERVGISGVCQGERRNKPDWASSAIESALVSAKRLLAIRTI